MQDRRVESYCFDLLADSFQLGYVLRTHKWLLLVFPLLGIGLGMSVSYLLVSNTNPLYESQAVIDIRGSKEAIRPLVDEIALIKSRDLLRKVIEDLELMERWSENEDQVLQILDDLLKLEVIHGTNLIRVRARHASADKAEQILEGFLDALKKKKIAEDQREIKRKSLRANAAIRNQEEEIALKKQELEEFLKPESPFFQQLQSNPNAIEQYHHAKSELEMSQQLLDRMRDDLKKLDVYRKALKEPIHLHEEHSSNGVPIQPNPLLCLATGAVTGAFCGFGLLMILIRIVRGKAA